MTLNYTVTKAAQSLQFQIALARKLFIEISKIEVNVGVRMEIIAAIDLFLTVE